MKQTIQLTTAQALIKFLQAQRIQYDNNVQPFFAGIWGIFGHGNVTGIGQALEQDKSFKYYQARNEQAMVHAAVAFAKQKRRYQAFACTSSVGPGATNMITGAALATINRIPVLLLPGDTFARRTPGPVLQQLEYQGLPECSVNDAFKPVSRFWDKITRPEQILHSLPEAVRILTSPEETGCATICFPQDVQTETFVYPETFFLPRIHIIERRIPSLKRLDQAIELILSSHNPLIIVGGGVPYSKAEHSLHLFCKQTGIPCAETQAGKGSISWDQSFNLGAIGVTGTSSANLVAQKADLVIFIGTRLADFTTASGTQFQNPKVQFISINTTSFDAHKFNALPLIGDAKAIIDQMRTILLQKKFSVNDDFSHYYTSKKQEWFNYRDQLTQASEKSFTQAQIIAELNGWMNEDDTVVCAAGSLPGDLHKLFNARSSEQYHMEYGYSCMGYEIAGGLGVQLAKEQGQTYVLVGDGSYLMMHTEILTSIQEQQKIVIILIQNNMFSSINNLSKSCGSLGFGNEFRYRNPENHQLTGDYITIDYANNIRSLGAYAFEVTSIVEFISALEESAKSPTSCAIVAKVRNEKQVPCFHSKWEVPVSKTSQMNTVILARKKYEEEFPI